ncbi:hypothetical protein C9J85_18675 [Haloferax sp. wsp5]|nr:hypothetical protein C9J85_18675 [Haloferax sp. wsp5]
MLLTDGQGNGGRAEAQTAADRGTTIYTIGFGGAYVRPSAMSI